MVQELRAVRVGEVGTLQSFSLEVGNAVLTFENGVLYSNKQVKELAINEQVLIAPRPPASTTLLTPDETGEAAETVTAGRRRGSPKNEPVQHEA